MTLLRRAVNFAHEQRAYSVYQSDDPWTIPPPGGALGQMASSGEIVNDQSTLGVATFFAGLRLLSDTISFTPLSAITRNTDGTRKPVAPSPIQIADPFWAIDVQGGIGQIVMSLILRGNAYVFDTTTEVGQQPLWRILHPDQVEVDWYRQNERYMGVPVGGSRKYTVGGQEVNPWKMTHVTMFMLPNALKGAGIIEYVRDTIGIGLALEDVAGQLFRNGIRTTGVLSTDQPMDADLTRQVADRFRQMHSGSSNWGLPVVLGGGAKWTPITMTPEDSQFLQSRQFQAGQAATLLGIPPHLLGITDKTTSWGTGIEVQGRAFVDYTLRFYFERLKAMFSKWLPPGQYAHFDTDEITRADTETRFKNYSVALGTASGSPGFILVDEVRAKENLPPLPNGAGQVFYRPATVVPASNAEGIITPAAPANTPAPVPQSEVQQ